ncbi:MAG: DUF1592 domain-containing protein [Bryobacterales bacterium]|nr:DUF1592 domain-containing protein [Bryobacterales bacterium]
MVLVPLLFTVCLAAQDRTYETRIQPLLAKYCYNCHNNKTATGNVNLESLKPGDGSKTKVWEHVADRVAGNRMPPPGAPAPSFAERKAIEAWVASLPGVTGKVPTAGRVTARRLNRAEYNNTIRDLLGFDIRPADTFPVDDSGYGFDNNGDVLSLSPMLMEKYLASARRLAKLAVNGAPVTTPSILAHYLGKRSGDNESGSAGSSYLPYSMRGALYGTYVFPADAQYEFRFRVVDRRLDESRAVPVVLFVDGQRAFDGPVEGGRKGNYHRGEYTARVPVTAGVHTFRVSFPHLAARDPRSNVAADKIRKLFVEYLDIVGPFEPRPRTLALACGHGANAHNADCPRRITGDLSRRAWRRGATTTELDRLTTLFTNTTVEHGTELVLQALLSSADFLFRFERSGGDYELASRLSYFLWSSMPDDELLRLADDKQLSNPAILKGQIRRMLADAKADALVENFAGQWLGLRSLARAKPDPARFPTADDELLDDMRTETTAFVKAVFREDRNINDLLDAPFTYVNGPLARHYGMDGVTGEAFERVALQGQRRGILTQASILTVSSYPTRTSPVIRGKWVLENILGAPPPPPPPNVPLLEENKIDPNVSFRKQLEQHRANPTCAACHNNMDSIGFGFENYDAVGAWRTHEGPNPVDASGTLPGGKTFGGPLDLIAILKGQSDAFARTFTEKLLTFALGRGLERYDRDTVEAITKAAAQEDYRFSAFVHAIVNSGPFRNQEVSRNAR